MDLLLIWPFIGLLAGIPEILELCKLQEHSLGAHTRRQSLWKSLMNDQSWWMRAALPMYLLHQFEEHGYDFMGRQYAFRSHFCDHLVRPPLPLSHFTFKASVAGNTYLQTHVQNPGLREHRRVSINATGHTLCQQYNSVGDCDLRSHENQRSQELLRIRFHKRINARNTIITGWTGL